MSIDFSWLQEAFPSHKIEVSSEGYVFVDSKRVGQSWGHYTEKDTVFSEEDVKEAIIRELGIFINDIPVKE